MISYPVQSQQRPSDVVLLETTKTPLGIEIMIIETGHFHIAAMWVSCLECRGFLSRKKHALIPNFHAPDTTGGNNGKYTSLFRTSHDSTRYQTRTMKVSSTCILKVCDLPTCALAPKGLAAGRATPLQLSRFRRLQATTLSALFYYLHTIHKKLI